MPMRSRENFCAAVIVAHPDDETLWAGGTILMHPEWQWTIVTLCRRSDPDRAPRFFRALQEFKAQGAMGDLNDEPSQPPLADALMEETVLSLLPQTDFSLLVTHGPRGEYTRHRRHEETSRVVGSLWSRRILRAPELWMFAYRDSGMGGIEDPPRPIETAHRRIDLPEEIWKRKYRIITEIYGFDPRGYEANIVQREEAFWRFRSAARFQRWLKTGGRTL